MNIWTKPEIERRKLEGKIKGGTEIRRVQVIFTLGKPPEVKFNEEVSITARAKANRDIIKGEEIKYSDIDGIEEFIVNIPPNSGHITLFKLLDSWIFIFDARYNKERKEKIKKDIESSKEFYESAKDNLEKNRLMSFYGHCWDSAELSAMCHTSIIGGKHGKHIKNVKNFEELGKLGMVNEGHVEPLSELKGLNNLQYNSSTEFKNRDHKKTLKFVKEMIEEAEKLLVDDLSGKLVTPFS